MAIPALPVAPATPVAYADLGQQVESLALETYDWVIKDSGAAISAVGSALAIYAVFFALRWTAVKLLGVNHSVTSWRGFTSRIIRRTRSPFIAVVSAWLVTHLVATPAPLQALINFAFTIAFAVQGALWLREILLALVDRRAATGDESHELDSAIDIIKVLVNVVVWILAVILILDNLGVNVTALVAGLGVGGIAIGLAAQGIFSDLFAALSILFDRPFRTGDTIRFGEVIGSVEAIGLKTTRIRATTGEQVIISNAKLLDQQIRNLRRIEARTTVMSFQLDLNSDTGALAGVPAMLTEVLAAMHHVDMKRAHVTAVTATSIEVEVEFTVEDASLMAMLNTKQQVLLAALDGFRGLGLALADTTPKVQLPAAVAEPPKRVTRAG